MTKRRVTQSDVAAIAGVSQATVSLILNDRTPPGVRIAEETRQRVLDAIAITGYTANPIAQRLAGGRNQILGVFTYESTFPRGGRDFYGPFLVGIEHAAEALGAAMATETAMSQIRMTMPTAMVVTATASPSPESALALSSCSLVS